MKTIADDNPISQARLAPFLFRQGALAAVAQWRGLASDLLPRYISHIVLLSLTLFASYLGNLNPLELRSNLEAAAATGGEQPPQSFIPSLTSAQEVDYLLKGVVPLTIIPPRPRREVITYVVQSGDVVTSIAVDFGLKPETVLWSNAELASNPDLLYTGQKIFILPIDGVYHLVQPGDTLDSIANKYKATVEAIITSEYNLLQEPYTIEPGQWLVVPGGSKPYIPRVVESRFSPPPQGAAKGSGAFMWPVSGIISQSFWSGHLGIDIAAPEGTPIYAADSGYVQATGWSGGYGNRVIIDHGNGYQTLYGHMSIILIQPGMSVQRGDLIGRVGETGRATGPHIHFELWLNGVKRNPFGFLP